MRLPSIRNLQYLIALEEELHFAKAAEKCFVSQSTLSAGISKLEAELGVALVERNNKNVEFTTLGKKIAGQARVVISDAQDLLSLAKTDFLESEIVVGAIPTIATYILPEFLEKVEKEFPNLKISFIEDTSDNLLKKTTNNEIDFALFAFPYDLPESIESYKLFVDQLHLVKHKSRSSNNIGKGELLLLEQGHCLRSHIMQGASVTSSQVSDFSCSSISTLIAMIDMNIGVSLLPKIAIDFGVLSHYPNLKYSSTSNTSREIGAIYKKSNQHSADIVKILSCLKF